MIQHRVPMFALAGGGAVPLRFTDSTAEHLSTRRRCGLFDFSFMGAWEISGAGAIEHLERLQTRDPTALVPGQIAYTLLCADDGTIINDATIWMFAPDRYWLFTGRKTDAVWIEPAAAEGDPSTVRVTRFDQHAAVLALQGPASGRLLASIVGRDIVASLTYFRFTQTPFLGGTCQIGRIGYSGELGYEIVLPAERALDLWQRLREAGHAYGLLECGFTAADSLRVEAGHILFANELARSRRPIEVGLARLVANVSPRMRGQGALRRAVDASSRLVCVELADSSSPRDESLPQLELTSDVVSPSFGVRLGLGFAPPDHSTLGTRLRCADGTLATVCNRPRHDPTRERPRAQPLG